VILAAMLGYYVFAVGVLMVVGYAVAQQNARQFKVQADAMVANLGRFHTPPEPTDVPTAVIADGVASVPVTKTSALVLTFRVVPEQTVDALVGMTSLLIRRVIDREVELGGEGMALFPTEVNPGSRQVQVRLIPTKRDGATERIAKLLAELNAGSRSAKDHNDADRGDLASRISRNSTAPLPESALRQLEVVALA
jgi:hypothetical protein